MIWLRWIAASAIGGAIVGVLEAGRFQFMATLILAGFIVGTMQWLVLRRHIRGAGWWILLSGIGLVLGNLLQINIPFKGALVTLLGQRFGLWEVFWLNLVNWPIVLLTTSLLQWLLLRQFAGAGWWLPVSVVSGMLLGVSSTTFCIIGCDMVTANLNAQMSTAFTYGTGWAAYAVGTGWLMAWFLHRDARL